MARPKRVSDDVYNARRRIRRAAKAAERKGETERARQLRLLAEQTYIGRGAVADVSRAASAALAAMGRLPDAKRRREMREQNEPMIRALRAASRSASTRGAAARLARGLADRSLDKRAAEIARRRNDLFARQLSLASAGGESTLDRPDLTGKSQARIFWMSTRRIWMGARPEDRYDAIMRALGTSSLQDAFDRVMDLNRDALESAIRVERPIRDTISDMTDERGDEPSNIGSPPEFMYLVRDAYNLVNLMS